MTGQVLKPCPYRREHEWEPESISTPREICRHCYAERPEQEIVLGPPEDVPVFTQAWPGMFGWVSPKP